MKNLRSGLLKSFCGAMMVTGTLFASDEPVPVKEEVEQQLETIAAGPRFFNDSEHAKFKDERAVLSPTCGKTIERAHNEEQQEEEKIDPAVVENLKEVRVFKGLITKQAKFSSHKGYQTYVSTHPAAWHTTILLWAYNEKVELSDGSIWAVAPEDRWKLSDWLMSDIMFVLPCDRLLYDYTIVNQRLGDYVDVNLVELEVLPYDPTFRLQRLWITDIDYVSQVVYLNDGTRWAVSAFDGYILYNWSVGQVVIVGINDRTDYKVMPNILINFNQINYVRSTTF